MVHFKASACILRGYVHETQEAHVEADHRRHHQPEGQSERAQVAQRDLARLLPLALQLHSGNYSHSALVLYALVNEDAEQCSH